jgi:Arc/MetJ-type ribon-helix-helix transcriptional regulator
MKLSVSLPKADVEFLDSYAAAQGLGSRSSAMRKAVRLLRGAEFGAAYEDAFAEWEATDGDADWDVTRRDGGGPHASR